MELCERRSKAKGLCGKHYMQAKRANNPSLRKKEIVQVGLWRKNNPENLRKLLSEYRNKNKTRLSEYYKEWRSKNRAVYNSYQKSRKNRVKQSTPKWADLKAIRQFYFNCPAGFHVDHIIPITGELVCGLHILGNLQYLSAIDNLKKGNRLLP